MKKLFVLLFFLTSLLLLDLSACTTAIISGKYTKNGRPMIWKNRDTWALKNHVRYFTGFKYEFMGLVNSQDSLGKSVWIGVNKVGFAIMNSASYNLNVGDNDKLTGLEGQVIKDALANCKTLADFESYLDSLPKPTGLEANFGVIDADGGAAYYETNNKGYVKFDANDPKVAPFGYIIRANYSHTGQLGVGSGYIRYNTANELFYGQQSTVGLTPQFIEQNVTKGLGHFLTKEDLFQQYGNLNPGVVKYAHFLDYIPRTGSSSSVVVEGVMPGENPNLCAMWSDVGFPLSSIVVPTFFADNVALPYVTTYKSEIKDAPVCNAALQLKNEQILNIRWGEKDDHYINVNALANNQNTGIRQIIKTYEDEIYRKANILNNKQRNEGKVNVNEVKAFYKWMDDYIKELYKKEFEIEI